LTILNGMVLLKNLSYLHLQLNVKLVRIKDVTLVGFFF